MSSSRLEKDHKNGFLNRLAGCPQNLSNAILVRPQNTVMKDGLLSCPYIIWFGDSDVNPPALMLSVSEICLPIQLSPIGWRTLNPMIPYTSVPSLYPLHVNQRCGMEGLIV